MLMRFCWLNGIAECWPRLCHRKLGFTSTPAIFSSPTLTHFFKVQVICQMCTGFSKVNIKYRLLCTWSRQARQEFLYLLTIWSHTWWCEGQNHLPCCDKSQHHWPGSLPLLLSTAYHLWHKYLSLKHTSSKTHYLHYIIIFNSPIYLKFSTHLRTLKAYSHWLFSLINVW